MLAGRDCRASRMWRSALGWRFRGCPWVEAHGRGHRRGWVGVRAPLRSAGNLPVPCVTLSCDPDDRPAPSRPSFGSTGRQPRPAPARGGWDGCGSSRSGALGALGVVGAVRRYRAAAARAALVRPGRIARHEPSSYKISAQSTWHRECSNFRSRTVARGVAIATTRVASGRCPGRACRTDRGFLMTPVAQCT